MEPNLALEKLGEMTPHQIAVFFEGREIMGCKWDGVSCPVHNYMLEETGMFLFVGYDQIFQVESTSRLSSYGTVEYSRVPGGFTMKTPESVAEFMNMFDENKFSKIRSPK